MFNLTRLRNSLPPAHSFGSITSEMIKTAATVRLTGSNYDAPHYAIGEALAKLFCWQDFFGDYTYISTDPTRSPFVEINKRVNNLLEDLQNPRAGGSS